MANSQITLNDPDQWMQARQQQQPGPPGGSAQPTPTDPDVWMQAHANNPQTPEQASVLGFLKNAATSTLGLVGDVGGAILHPGQTLGGITGLLEGMAEKSGAPPVAGVSHAPYVDGMVDLYKKRYGSWDGLKNALYTDPAGVAADLATLAGGTGLLSKAVEATADAANLGRVADVAGTVRQGAAAVQHAVDLPRWMTTGAAKLTEVAGAPKLADYLYRTALRGGYRSGQFTPDELRELTQTGLTGSIPVSETGGKKIYSALQDLQQTIQDKVDAASRGGTTVSRDAILQRLQPVEQRFGMQVAPESDLKDINKVGDQFVRTNPPDIPAATAQAKKIGTYEQLQGKYGKLSDAEAEAQKALARGIKEELSNAIPELNNLNPKEASFLNLQGVIEKAVNKRFTSNGGISPWLAGGAAGAASHNPWIGGAVGVMKDILADPNLRSSLAIAINKGQLATPALQKTTSWGTALSRLKAYQDSFGQ